MPKLGKTFAAGRTVLRDSSLSFLPGDNASTRSAGNGVGEWRHRRRIIAQVRETCQFTVEAGPAAGQAVGYLSQEPVLDEGEGCPRYRSWTVVTKDTESSRAARRAPLKPPERAIIAEPMSH